MPVYDKFTFSQRNFGHDAFDYIFLSLSPYLTFSQMKFGQMHLNNHFPLHYTIVFLDIYHKMKVWIDVKNTDPKHKSAEANFYTGIELNAHTSRIKQHSKNTYSINHFTSRSSWALNSTSMNISPFNPGGSWSTKLPVSGDLSCPFGIGGGRECLEN